MRELKAKKKKKVRKEFTNYGRWWKPLVWWTPTPFYVSSLRVANNTSDGISVTENVKICWVGRKDDMFSDKNMIGKYSGLWQVKAFFNE